MLFILDGKTERGSHTHTHYETREKTSKKKKKGGLPPIQGGFISKP